MPGTDAVHGALYDLWLGTFRVDFQYRDIAKFGGGFFSVKVLE